MSYMTAPEPVRDLYRQLIDGWNAQDANAMAAALSPSALVVGFDGSQMFGREEVATELGRVFADHETATYVSKVRSVTQLGSDAALLHAVVGMVPADDSEIMPDLNAVQTVVAHRAGEQWSVALFQTTPAQFHGRPELSQALTQELSASRKER
jgi:uncharacterized protein (TIGR02246 family)